MNEICNAVWAKYVLSIIIALLLVAFYLFGKYVERKMGLKC